MRLTTKSHKGATIRMDLKTSASRFTTVEVTGSNPVSPISFSLGVMNYVTCLPLSEIPCEQLCEQTPSVSRREVAMHRPYMMFKAEPRVPTDLRNALAATPSVEAVWRDLTPIARRDFISWIDSARQLETRRRRIEKACDKLASGKRRPCCYAIVPMNLYKALAAIPGAKAQWRDLTPTARRDFVSWIDSAKQPEIRRQRIEKACLLLAPVGDLPETRNSAFSTIRPPLRRSSSMTRKAQRRPHGRRK